MNLQIFSDLHVDVGPVKQITIGNCQRRRAIEAMDILEPVPGIPGRTRLLVGLDCRSPAMAGKILSGAHVGNKIWQAQPGLPVGAPS
jgi:hypothetical protein